MRREFRGHPLTTTIGLFWQNIVGADGVSGPVARVKWGVKDIERARAALDEKRLQFPHEIYPDVIVMLPIDSTEFIPHCAPPASTIGNSGAGADGSVLIY